MYKIILLVIFLFLILLSLYHNETSVDDPIESITLVITPTFGNGPLISDKTTIYSNGDVVASHGKFNVGESNAAKLIKKFYDNGFFDWSDNLSTDSSDGSFIYFEVVTEKNYFKKGGLNPDFEKFVDCKKAFYECIGK